MPRKFSLLSLAFGALLLSLAMTRSVRAADDLSVASPDGKVVISFALKSNPQPYLPGVRAYYRVSYGGVQVLTDSPLGLDFEGAPALDHDLEITGKDHHSHDETWTNRFGMSRDWDRPMDFADATLVYLARRESLSVILTVDQADFATYRIEGKRQFRVLPNKRP